MCYGATIPILEIRGQTSSGLLVIGGVYKFYETFGLSLDVIVDLIVTQKNAVVDWVDFYNSALKAGMNGKRILAMIESACSDVLTAEYSTEILWRLNRFKTNEVPKT